MLYFVTLGAFLFCSLNQGESVVILTLTSSVVRIQVGSSVTLSCNVFGLEDDFFNQDGYIKVIRLGDYVNTDLSYFTPTKSNTSSSRYKVNGKQRSDRYVVDFHMTKIVEEDASAYQCVTFRANNWDQGSTYLQLQLIRTASIEYPKCYGFMDNDKLHLECESTGSVPPPDLVWFHNGVEVSRNTEIKYSFHSNELIMNQTDVNGTFECRFYYIGGGINDERSCRIEKPNIAVFSPANTEFINGSDAKITVLARASPPMKTTLLCEWDHSNTKGFTVQTDGNDLAMITILDIDITMNGSQITCCGRNYMGRSCKSIFLFVKENLPNRIESLLTELVIIVSLVCAVVVLTAVALILFRRGRKSRSR